VKSRSITTQKSTHTWRHRYTNHCLSRNTSYICIQAHTVFRDHTKRNCSSRIV